MTCQLNHFFKMHTEAKLSNGQCFEELKNCIEKNIYYLFVLSSDNTDGMDVE